MTFNIYNTLDLKPIAAYAISETGALTVTFCSTKFQAIRRPTLKTVGHAELVSAPHRQVSDRQMCYMHTPCI